MKTTYKPKYLSWTKSYEAEVNELRNLIAGNPSDVKQLKEKYHDLTGKRYRYKSSDDNIEG